MDRRNKEQSKCDFKDEETGKELYRYAFAYSERLEQQLRLTRNVEQIFHSDLVNLRNKIQKKCEQILYLSCSKRRKAEELLWKSAIYSVISYCKQHKLIFDTSHPCHHLYSSHLMNATVYYQQLLHSLQDHYGIHITKLNTLQLEELETTNQCLDTLWLREASQRCLIYLGDVARYQVDLGFNPEHSMSYYSQAVSIDPSNGCPYNQLAALSESLQQPLEAIFYYLRSMTAQKPFHGIEKNIERLLRRNESKLSELESNQQSIPEPQLPRFNKDLLLSKFLQLQNLFLRCYLDKQSQSKPVHSSSSNEIGSLCSSIVSVFEDCLAKDEHQYVHQCLQIAQNILETNNGKVEESSDILIDDSFLLKLSTLTILPAYKLRLKGSSNTLLACAFVLSIFSLLLLYVHKRLVHQTLAVMCQQKRDAVEREMPSVDEIIESEVTMIELLEGKSFDTKISNNSKSVSATKSTSATSKKSASDKISKIKEERKKQKLKQIDRRRRKRKPQQVSSSDEENSDSLSDQLSDERISLSSLDDNNIGEDDLDMIESLSECSSNESDDNTAATRPLAKEQPSIVQEQLLLEEKLLAEKVSTQPTKAKTRRKLVLAANFSMVDNSKEEKEPKQNQEVSHTSDIAKLHTDTKSQFIVHIACSIISKEYYLKSIKVIVDWLQSYPAVLATYGKTSTTTIWSRLAYLLNFLPSEEVLYRFGLVETHSCSSWAQTYPTSEDKVLRGFAPLLRVHQGLDYSETNSGDDSLREALVRMQCLIKFGHNTASSKTVPSFERDTVSGRFVGPDQREKEQRRQEELERQKSAEEAKFNRSRLMKAMAHQRLQSEVESLAKANAKTQKSLFTTYLLPDAHTFCMCLHIVKKLINTEQFVIIVAKSVIESLDLMKKEKDNFVAREAIKFLEKELKAGNRFLKAQSASETAQPSRKKPHKQDISEWLFDGLVDCAIYFNSGSSAPLLTLLLDKSIVREFEEGSGGVESHSMEVLTAARQHGVEIDNILRFYKRWQSSCGK